MDSFILTLTLEGRSRTSFSEALDNISLEMPSMLALFRVTDLG